VVVYRADELFLYIHFCDHPGAGLFVTHWQYRVIPGHQFADVFL
jgi:hypothetical protein